MAERKTGRSVAPTSSRGYKEIMFRNSGAQGYGMPEFQALVSGCNRPIIGVP